MKKITFLIVSLTVLFIASCTDESGKYSQQLFSDNEISTALKQCLTYCSDSANHHLLVSDNDTYGYYHYNNNVYRLQPSALTSVFDTLRKYGHSDNVDTFIYKLNNAASSCSIEVKDYFRNVTSDILFDNPVAILYGFQHALTDYFRKIYTYPFITAVASFLPSCFTDHEIPMLWNELLSIYANYDLQPVNIDLQWQTAQQMVIGFLKEMEIEEMNIRTQVSHRGSKETTLYRVFATLDIVE